LACLMPLFFDLSMLGEVSELSSPLMAERQP
jgi:hypothetical protein